MWWACAAGRLQPRTWQKPRSRARILLCGVLGALARFPLCRFEQVRDATREEKLELVAGADLRFSYCFLGSFALESLSLPPPLPRLFTLHSDTVAKGSDI